MSERLLSKAIINRLNEGTKEEEVLYWISEQHDYTLEQATHLLEYALKIKEVTNGGNDNT